MEEENASGVNLLVNEEERKELPNLANDGVPRSPILGECTLPSISIDCLQHYSKLVYMHIVNISFKTPKITTLKFSLVLIVAGSKHHPSTHPNFFLSNPKIFLNSNHPPLPFTHSHTK